MKFLVWALLGGAALVAPALSALPGPYQITQTRALGPVLLLLAETSRAVPSIIVEQPTLQTTTLLISPGSQTGQTRWKRYLGQRWSITGSDRRRVGVQQAIPGGERTRVYALSDGELLEEHRVYRATPTAP